ncbi:GNAT family N-acetyltransferase [Mycoplasmatota bacterium]|nr:GNAT family N-acetyltransferase [Mycoplasmatota bacterium]
MKFLKDNTVLDIQEAKSKDAKDLLAFLEKVKNESNFLVLKDTGVDKTVEEQEEYLNELRNKVTSKLFLGKVSGSIIASGGIYHRKDSIEGNVVLDINVLNAYLGLGTEEHILNHVINYARITSEIRSIDILTTKDNKDIISVYEQTGFKEIDAKDSDINHGVENNTIVLRLKIK